MMATSKWLAIVGVAFVAGSFIASPELKAFAANTIGSTDIINESILSEDIKNNQVKASDIATDAVGASELQGVTKLLYAQCQLTDAEESTSINPGFGITIDCAINGVDADDTAVATMAEGSGNACLSVTKTNTVAGAVLVTIRNVCTSSSNAAPGAVIAIVVFDK